MGHNNNDNGAHMAKERDITFSGVYTNILLEMLVQYIVGIYLHSHLVGVRGLNIGRI